MGGYPFARHARSRCDGWQAYNCRFCGERDYAAPDSAPYVEQVCVDCDVAGVTAIANKKCDRHGSFRAYITTTSPAGEGSCPHCIDSTAAPEVTPQVLGTVDETPFEALNKTDHARRVNAISDIYGGRVSQETVDVCESWARSEPDRAEPWIHLSEALVQIALSPANRGVCDVRLSRQWAAAVRIDQQGPHGMVLITPDDGGVTRAVWSRAVAAADKAVERDARDSDALRQRALIALLWERDKKRARQLAEQILALRPDQAQAREILAKVSDSGGGAGCLMPILVVIGISILVVVMTAK